MSDKAATLKIETGEGVEFRLKLASPVVRLLAWGIDLGVIMAAMTVIGMMVSLLSVISLDLLRAIGVLLYFLVSIGYFMVSEWAWRGQTLGKRILNIRVVDVNGLKLEPSQIFIRNLLRVVDSLPVFYFVGGVSSLLNGRAQRLGDLAASTIVISQPKLELPDLSRIGQGKYNSFRQHPHLEALLRQRVSPELASVALRSLLRRDQIDDAARIEVFSEIAEALNTVSPFPEEITQTLSHEQYVRNCVDSIYRKHQRV